nr:hypothetical protein [Tanacetum cinerariifolium]
MVDGLYCRHCALLRKKLKEDPGENSSQSPPYIDHYCFFRCGDSLDGIFCQRCTCKSCGKGAHYGYNCLPKVQIIFNPEPCHKQNIDEFPQTLPSFHPACYSGDENSFAYDLTPNFVNNSPDVFNPPSQPLTYSYEFCGNDAQYGHDCPPQVPFIYNPELCYNQDFNFPQNFQSFQQQYPCCESCGGPHETFQCQQVIFYEPCCENCEGAHENFQCQPMNYYELNPCCDSNYYGFDNFQPSQFVIDHLNLQQRINDSMILLRGTFQAWLQQRKDQVVNLDSYSPKPLQCQKIPICYNDDDDEESSTPLRDIIISELPPCIAITPVLSTRETKDSLIMRDEHLDTIPEKESNEFIKSSVENLVPNPSKSEDEHECDVPVCDDFITFSNLLFDADDNFPSSDEKSFSDEDIMKEIYSNPLFDKEIISIKIDPHYFNAESELIESLLNQDSSIISSSKIDSLLDEFVSELILLKSIPPGIDEADCDPKEEIHLIKKLLDILILEELLSNDSLSLPENESFHFDIPSSPRPPAKLPDDDEIKPNSGILTVKVAGDIFEHCVLMLRLLPTQPTLASNQEKSLHLLSHQGLKAFQLSFKSPMMSYGGNIPILHVPFLHFYPP